MKMPGKYMEGLCVSILVCCILIVILGTALNVLLPHSTSQFQYLKTNSDGTIKYWVSYMEDNVRYEIKIKLVNTEKETTYYFDDGTSCYMIPPYGNGIYEVNVTKYADYYELGEKQVHSSTFSIRDTDESIYKNKSSVINWKDYEEELEELWTQCKEVNAVYSYIRSFGYNTELAEAVKNGEVWRKDFDFNLGEVLENKKAACNEAAYLMVTALRYKGIPAKLVYGYCEEVNGYHAWSEVYLDGEWVIYDTVLDKIINLNKADGYEKVEVF